MITIALGAGGLFAFQGMNGGMLKQYKTSTIRVKYGHGQFFFKGFRDQVHEEPWNFWIPGSPAITERISKLPGVENVFPRVSFNAIVSEGSRSSNGYGLGVRSRDETRFFNQLHFNEGKHFVDDENAIALGSGLARTLEAKVGDTVSVSLQTIHGSMNAADFTVSGIFETGLKEFDDFAFRVEFSRAQLLLDTDKAESIGVGLSKDEYWPEVAQAVGRDFSTLEAVPFEILDQIYYGNSVAWLKSQFGVIQDIILLIVLLGIFNSVSISIFERKFEFGALRANGEKRRHLFLILLLESTFMGALGSLIGVFAIILMNVTLLKHGISTPPAPGFTLPMNFHLELGFTQALLVTAYGCLTAMIGTVFAGFKILRISIPESLRS